MSFHHYYQQTKSNLPETTPNANPSHTLGNNNLNPIYVETSLVAHDLHELESYQKDILIKTFTVRLDI